MYGTNLFMARGRLTLAAVAGLLLIGGRVPPVTAQGLPDPPAAERQAAGSPALLNADEIVPLLIRWYRRLNTQGGLADGSVLLQLVVDPNGSVREARVVQPTGHHPALNMLARRAARRMRFAPSGSTSARGVWILQRITFRE